MTTKDYETRDTNSKKDDSSSSFLLGAIIGGVVGAAAAILLAPRSGKEIRSTINTQAGSLKEKTIQLLNKSTAPEESFEETNYISIGGTTPKENHDTSLDEVSIRKKLEETKKAMEEEEYKVTH